jgi:hypothetical protein
MSTVKEYTASLNMDTEDNVGPVNISRAECGIQQPLYSIPRVHTRAY